MHDGIDGDDTETLCASLGGMPAEILARILAVLPAVDVAAMGAVCRRFSDAASCATLWKSLYRRDFGCDAPPDEHKDFVSYGKGVRWLYALAATAPSGVHRDPTTRRLCARLLPTAATGSRSGEFCLVTDPATGQVALQLDGYGSLTDAKGCIFEGVWKAGVFVGPGRVRYDDKNEVWCEAFGEGAVAHGRGIKRYANAEYVGELSGGVRCGWGRCAWSSGTCKTGEWMNDAVDGRVLTNNNGTLFSGQRKGNVDHRGVKRKTDKTTSEYSRKEWKIRRRAPRGASVNRSVKCEGETSETTCAPGWVRRWYADDIERLDLRSSEPDEDSVGYVVVRYARTLLLLHIADHCPDAMLAGRRFSAFDAVHMDGNGTTTTPEAVVSAFVRYLGSPGCAIAKGKANALLGTLGRTDIGAKRGSTSRADPCDAAAPVDGLGLPFGRALSLAGHAEPVVRCFLSGDLVPAIQCSVVSSGRAYCTHALDMWLAREHHGTTDPETGQSLTDTGRTLPWRQWMMHTAPSLIAWAMDRTRNLPEADDVKDRDNVSEDAVRLMILGAAQAAAGPKMATKSMLADVLTVGVNVARSYDAPLMRGFDALSLSGVEFRHPQWDPRGPWRLGPPSKEDLPDDPTLGEHERADAGPLDFFDSHGIVRVALTSPSFIATRLDGVFFFGHTLCQASFAGAWLSDCAFVDCVFDRCVFADAALIRCAFFGCTMTNGSAIDETEAMRRITASSLL